jgi:sugar (pentulose or hexulose) kinase
MNLFCGIDIGSSSIKIAITNEAKELIAFSVSPTGSSFKKKHCPCLKQFTSEKCFHKREYQIHCINRLWQETFPRCR